jgi:hypothetical protein
MAAALLLLGSHDGHAVVRQSSHIWLVMMAMLLLVSHGGPAISC